MYRRLSAFIGGSDRFGARLHVYPCIFIGMMTSVAGCARDGSHQVLQVTPAGNSCELIIAGPEAVGDMRLWLPEAIMSNDGGSAVYPHGGPWERVGGRLVHRVDETGIYGGGNCPRIDEHTFECAGIRFPVESPVHWTTTLTPGASSVAFEIELTNVGGRPIRKACAAICLKFLQGAWWKDESVYVRSGGAVRSLAELGRDAGRPNAFQAYLLVGESFDNVFYQEFWGFSRYRLDTPVMVSEHAGAGLRVGITAERAHFLHSNRGNPCTDVAMAFGDLAPGATATTAGRVWIHPGPPSEHLREAPG
jgi:hypothetical protein